MDILNPTLIWFLVGTVLALMEFAVPGVILIFFAIGAWVVSFTAWIGLTVSLQSQLLLFSFISVVLLLSLRRWIKGKFHGHVTGVQDLTTNLDEFTGKKVIVLEDVMPGRSEGKVEFKGSTWAALSDEVILKGEMAIISALDGISLRVKKDQGGMP